tara:strand:- start:1403 stop:1579 length:177 start_codon:yes stop_codon:yes gene_type:complete
MPTMSIALAKSISTSRCIETQGYNLRRHVITPIPQKKSKKKNKQNILCKRFKDYISKF